MGSCSYTLKYYKVPFQPRKHQVYAVDRLAELPRSGCYADVGTGKTFIATLCALYKGLVGEIDRVLILCPPGLVLQWCRWLERMSKLNGNIFRILPYRGTPAQRKRMPLDQDFIVMSIQIFKRDLERITQELGTDRTFVIVDEAACLRNPRTKNFRYVRDFVNRTGKVQLLTGTPIDKPIHAYGLIKLVSPIVYRSFAEFKLLHIEKADYWGNPLKYKNLDLLQDNLLIGTVRLMSNQVLDLPPIIYDPVLYQLTPAHKRLYDKLCEEQLLELPDGGVVDALTATRLYHKAQEVLLNPGEFGAPESMPVQGLSLILDLLSELHDDDKVIIFAHYQKSNESIYRTVTQAGYKAVLCYGKTNNKREDNIDQFITDPECRVLVANPGSIGVGTDGLQTVCRHMIFAELPLTPSEFTQAVARIHRDQQEHRCVVRMLVAEETIQMQIRQNVMATDDMLQRILPTAQSLRDALAGKVQETA